MAAKKSVRARLKRGETVVGGWIQAPHPAVAAVMASSGFDWLAMDLEHGVIGLAECAALVPVIEAHGCEPFVRLPGNAYADNKRYLDAGARGLIAPLVNTRENAEELVRSAKYPPEGSRGVGYAVSNHYGFQMNRVDKANDEILVCVQIEHETAVAHLDGILSVPGVDAAFVGPYDLSASLGVTAQFEHPDYVRALDRFRAACQEHGVAAGIHVVAPDPDEVLRRVDEGYRMFAYSLDVTMLGQACRTGCRAIREGLSARGNG